MNFNGNFMKILGGLAGVGSALVAANPNNSTGTRTTFAMLAAAVPTITSLFSGGGNNAAGAVNGQNANPSIFGAQQTQQANDLRSMYAAYAGNPTQQFLFVNNMRTKVQQEAQKVQQNGNTMYLKLNSQVNSQLEALKEKLEKKEIREACSRPCLNNVQRSNNKRILTGIILTLRSRRSDKIFSIMLKTPQEPCLRSFLFYMCFKSTELSLCCLFAENSRFFGGFDYRLFQNFRNIIFFQNIVSDRGASARRCYVHDKLFGVCFRFHY